MKIAPAGTDPKDTSKWIEIGSTDSISIDTEYDKPMHSWWNNSIRPAMPASRSVNIEFADGRRLFMPNASINWTKDETALEFNALPQRHMLGVPSEEDTLTKPASYFTGQFGASVTLSHPAPNHSVIKVNGQGGYTHHSTAASALKGEKDHSFLALQVLGNITGAKEVTTTTLDGRTTIETGNAKVYRAENEGEAARNLDFAIANLKSYLYWITDGRKAAKQREADLKAAEARAAKEKKAAEEKLRTERLALKLYNANRGTVSSTPWPWSMGAIQKDKWIALAKQAQAISNTGLVVDGAITSTQINHTLSVEDAMRKAFGPVIPRRSWL
jgi:hypothetical protein